MKVQTVTQYWEIQADVDRLLEEQASIRSELSEIDNTGSQEKDLFAGQDIVIYENGYIPRWTNVKKMAFVLKQKKRALTARQVYEVIINELEYTEWKDKTQKEKASFYGTISSTLVNNSKPGKEFVKSQNEIDENIYSLKN